MAMKKKCVPLLAVCAFCLFAAACTEPLPLYGIWADNLGNTINFGDNGKFNASIKKPGDAVSQSYSGTFTVLQNALTLKDTVHGIQIVTEWDIRGNMLYLNWASDKGALNLTLYKISN
jgi:hypothetical protein